MGAASYRYCWSRTLLALATTPIVYGRAARKHNQGRSEYLRPRNGGQPEDWAELRQLGYQLTQVELWVPRIRGWQPCNAGKKITASEEYSRECKKEVKDMQTSVLNTSANYSSSHRMRAASNILKRRGSDGKVTVFEEYFDDWIRPYVPVLPDRSDLLQKVEWVEWDDAGNGAVAERVTMDVQNDCYFFALLLEWARLLVRPQIKGAAPYIPAKHSRFKILSAFKGLVYGRNLPGVEEVNREDGW
ncbi:hypothetical protein B0H16DRAFT_1466924 [Mycena metata]|uniref:Uncharacterized protein n=1 Tax=Mycena metata TaxID=1033252 RepID=A0AAD7I780_9AGAR|nr:hypothetical protein B0H16DRAFT_1466924 [Mycena metata]